MNASGTQTSNVGIVRSRQYYMARASYLGKDSGRQAIAGESSRILKQFWNNPKNVSHWLSETPNSLLHAQLELEARVGIEP